MLNLHQLKSTQTPLDGHYLLIDRIGGGGFSEVWLAHDLRSQVDVVLKIYASVQGLDEEGVKMFRKEFSLVCNLNHTNILKPFTFDISQDSPYIVLPYCEKGSAAKLVGKMPEEELWNFAGQVAAGLAHLHKHSIIHQDIKPANVLINADNQYIITDFGISTGLRNTIRRSTNTTAGTGTTAYMAYECLAPKPSNVIARDIWAFGATLYELATGDVPFGEYGGITQKSMDGKIPKIKSEYSAGLKSLIYRCLSFEAWDRPSAEEIAKAVDDHKKGIKPKTSYKPLWIAMPVAAAVMLTIACWRPIMALIVNEDHIAAVYNPNDSILISKVEEANAMIRAEQSKKSLDDVDETKLCNAAELYKEAMSLDASDTVISKGKEMWMVSQDFINKAYNHFYDKSVEYSYASDASNRFLSRSEKIKQFVTVNKHTPSPPVQNKTLPTKKAFPSQKEENNIRPTLSTAHEPPQNLNEPPRNLSAPPRNLSAH